MENLKYVCALVMLTGCSAPNLEGGEVQEYEWATSESALNGGKPKPLEVEFQDCSEFAGLTFVPTENVSGLVPPGFELAHFTTPDEAVVVVRIANCDGVKVKNGPLRPGTVAQVGVTLAGPDATSDINNYTLWYVTDDKKLAKELNKVGVPAIYSEDIVYTFSPDVSGNGPFGISVSAPNAPDYTLAGTATTPTDPAVPFVASWWYRNCHDVVQMRTTLPQIQFGAASMSLEASGAALRAIVGDDPVSFPGLDSYNTFEYAKMIVTAD